MKNRKNKTFILLLIALMLLCVVPNGEFMVSGIGSPDEELTTVTGWDTPGNNTEGDFVYSVYGKEATITGCNKSFSGELVIPDTLGGYPVTGISYGVFRNCFDLTSVSIPNGVTKIGNYAFEGCTSLKTIVIPDSVVSIGRDAFNKTAWYSYQPYGDVYIGKVYYKYNGTMPANTSVSIIEGIKGIADSAFDSCTGLKSITIPKSVVNIGNGAFEDCTTLSIINWNAETVSDFAHHNYTFSNAGTDGHGIRIVFGDSVKRIPAYAFYSKWSGYYELPNIRSVDFGNSVLSIGRSAFEHCVGLTSISIPGSVIDIDYEVFSECSNLEEMIVSDDNSIYHSKDNCIVKTAEKKLCFGCKNSIIPQDSSVTRIGFKAFYGCIGLTGIVIPNTISIIEDRSFQNCAGLTSISIGNGVTSIGRDAFYGCTGLSNITIPDSVTSIESYAFQNCTGLMSATIGNGLKQISYGIFNGCTGLTRIEFGDNVRKIEGGAFESCTNLTDIIVSKNNSIYHSDGNCLINTAKKELILGCKSSVIPQDGSVEIIGDDAFKGCTGLINITVPDSVTSIGRDAFYDTAWYNSHHDGDVYAGKVYYRYKGSMPDNTCITLNEGTKGIADYAFEHCTGLKGILIPDSVLSIGDYAFYGCSELTSIIIPNGVTNIEERAFQNCYQLSSISIPNSVTRIGEDAFDNTQWLNNQSDGDVYIGEVYYKYKGKMPDKTSITIRDGTKCIADSAFWGCSGLINVDISSSLINIGVGAFYGSSLSSVTIPYGVKDINAIAFAFCDNLERIIIPNSITSIGEGAFAHCTSLLSTTIPSSVTNIDEYAFGYYEDEETGDIVKLDNFTIYGYCNTSAEIYANENGFVFIDLETHVHDCEEEIIKESTCTEKGEKLLTCDCGYSSIAEIPMAKHTEKTIPAIPATCTKPGLTEGTTCSVCRSNVKPQEEIPALGHDFVTDIEAVAATCTKPGNTEGKHCNRCGFEIDSEVIPEAGHIEATIPGKSPTCIEPGYTKGIICTVCGVLIEKIEMIPSLGHDMFTDTGMKVPTCTENGKTESAHCTRCDYRIEAVDISAIGHSEEIIDEKKATCLEPGYTQSIICVVCGEVLVESKELPALGHHMIATSERIEPTCTSTGMTESKHCTRCNFSVEASVIPMIEHTEEIISAVSATCTEAGFTDGKYCAICGKTLVEQKELPALGHNMIVDVESKEPTCTVSGTTEGSHCSRCGFIVEAEKIEPLGHTDDDNDGKCDRCGEKTGEPVDPPKPDDPYATCTHICHKGGISAFFYKIARFFWKLFKTNKYCSCGAAHY